MSTVQYIGSRYVPIFADPAEWTNTKQYEPLTIVLHEGNSFTSKQFVPVGIDINNTDYWAMTGSYNAQIELYRRDVSDLQSVSLLTFPTVSEMKSSDKIYAGATCCTLGFHAINDEGAGYYKIEENATPNEMDKIACGNYVAVLQYSNKLNVKALGAYGDNIHDDTTIIQYAINTTTPIIYFPAGNYKVTSTLSPATGISLSGCGGKNSIISFKPNARFINYGILFTSQHDVSFYDIGFDGNESNFEGDIPNGTLFMIYLHSNQDDAIRNLQFRGCYFTRSYDCAINSYGVQGAEYPHPLNGNITIHDCIFENIGTHGVGMNEWHDSSVTNCTFHNVGKKRIRDSIGSGLGVDVSGGCYNIVVSNNLIDGAGGGFKAETHVIDDTHINASKDVIFSNNVIKNLYITEASGILLYGVKLNGENIILDSNIIESYGHAVLFGVYAKNCSVIGNKIVGGLHRSAQGIRVDPNFGGHTIANNVITDASQQGIYSACDSILINGNTISNCTAGGIRVIGGNDVQVSNNIVHDITASNSTSIGVLIATGANATTVDNCLISNNIAYNGYRGFGLSNSGITNCKFIGNIAHDNSVYDFSQYIFQYSDIGNERKIRYSPYTPTNQAGSVGDIVINSLVNESSVIMWICIASGSPATWRAVNV